MNTAFPSTPFSSGVTPAPQALAFSETRSRFPRKGVTTVQPLTRLPNSDSLSPWGGPAEAA